MRIFNNKLNHKPTIERIVDNSSIQGNSRKTAWLYDKARRGFIHDVDKVRALSYANTIDSMITELNSHYGENWDIILEPHIFERKLKFTVNFVIYFPELNITNSNGDSHIIKDLYVDFTLSNHYDSSTEEFNFYPSHLSGFRTSYNQKEKAAAYAHSHLSGCNYNIEEMYSTEFCLGDDTEIVLTRESLTVKYTPEMFSMYLFNIETLVSWESIEGVPYKNMSLIEDYNFSGTVIYQDYNYIRQNVYERLLPHLRNAKLPVVFYENRFKIKENHFERLLHKAIKDYDPSSMQKIFVKIDATNPRRFICYNPDQVVGGSEERIISTENQYFYFRDRKIKLKQLASDNQLSEDITVDDYKVHKNFINYVTDRLEQELYKEEIRNSALKNYHISRYSRRGTT